LPLQPLPLKGQPLRGHSGIKKMDGGTFWILTDNGAGSKANFSSSREPDKADDNELVLLEVGEFLRAR